MSNASPEPPALLDGYLDIDETARAFRKTTRTIARWCALPDGPPYIKLGKKRLFSIERLQAWLDGLEHPRNVRVRERRPRRRRARP